MANYQLISNVSYKRVTVTATPELHNWIINPFDSNGNLISEITIEVDTTLGNASIFVPTLGETTILPFDVTTNGQTNFTIKIFKVSDDVNFVEVSSLATFSAYGNSIYLNTLKDSVQLTPIGLPIENTYQVLSNVAPVN
jgi:hypothetical protein